MRSTIELKQLKITPSLGTHGPNDVVPDAHLLDLSLTIDPALVFIDADKVNHKTYLECALKLSKPGTVIVADNVVRGGGVLDAESQDNSIKGIRELMAFAQTLEGVDMTALQTVGAKGYDGMAFFRVVG